MTHRQNYGMGSMGMPHNQLYGEYQPSLIQYQQRPIVSNEIAFDRFWPIYSKALYIISRTFDASDAQYVEALKLFFISLLNLVPNSSVRQNISDFLLMKPHVVKDLLNGVSNTFIAYPWLENMLKTDSTTQAGTFNQMCYKNQDGQALFLWMYLLDSYLIICQQKMNATSLQIKNLNTIRTMYQANKITKADWGNSIWFILHTASLYAPQPMQQSFENYKNLMSALRFLLPCPKCRTHLNENLKYIDFDNCPKNNQELFKCSWKLHNIVNVSDNKPQIGLQKAFAMYTF